jgi:hypothetical protein
MADAPAVQPAQTPGTQPANPAQTDNLAQPVTLTPEVVKSIVSEAVEAATRPLNAEIRRLGGWQKQPKTTDPAQTDRTLTQRVEAVEAREARLAERTRKDAIRAAGAAAGIPENRLDIFTDRVLSLHGEEVVLTGDDKAGWTDEGLHAERPLPVRGLVEKFLKTSAEADIFRPAANVPRAKALQSGGTQQRGGQQPDAVTEWDGMTQEQIAKLSGAELIARARAAVAANQQG